MGQSARSVHVLHPPADSLPLPRDLACSLSQHCLQLPLCDPKPPSICKKPHTDFPPPAPGGREQLLLGSRWEEPVLELGRNRAFVCWPVQPAWQPGKYNSCSQHIVLPLDGCELTPEGATKPPAPCLACSWGRNISPPPYSYRPYSFPPPARRHHSLHPPRKPQEEQNWSRHRENSKLTFSSGQTYPGKQQARSPPLSAPCFH